MNQPNQHQINFMASILPNDSNLYVLPNGLLGGPIHLIEKEQNNDYTPYLFPQSQTTISTPLQGLELQLNNGEEQVLPKCLSGEELKTVMPSNSRRTSTNNVADNKVEPHTISIIDVKQKKQVIRRKKHKDTLLSGSTGKIGNCVHIRDRIIVPRAIAVLPSALQMRQGCIFPKQSLPIRVKFGPVEGIMTKIFPAEADEIIYESGANKPIFLLRRDEDSVTHINVSDKEKSNWLSLLPVGDKNTANVWLYEEGNEIFGITVRPIRRSTFLVLGYSKKYADQHNLPATLPILDLDEALSEERWWCFDCRRALESAELLQRHISLYHKEAKIPRKKHRCTFCSRTFARLFGLKRHMARFCLKKSDISKNQVVRVSEKTVNNNKALEEYATNADDSKTLSDESFQNYTNGLDFSTNLFDTDRMPNLDLSCSVKSDADFRPYILDTADCNFMSNDIPNVEKQNKKVESNLSCTQCDYYFPKPKKCRPPRGNATRQFQCECGKSFRKKESLEQHVLTMHIQSKLNEHQRDGEESQKSVESVKEAPYKCDVCRTVFKRRGMLVNHLWRAHKTASTAIPFEKKVKHYPCPACPKIYLTSAKRNIHVQKHHPGVKKAQPAPLVGEVRKCEPASCTACPRQYTTRAKLLQHIRAQHPHLAIPTKPKSSTTSTSSKEVKPIQPTQVVQMQSLLFY